MAWRRKDGGRVYRGVAGVEEEGVIDSGASEAASIAEGIGSS